jgi:arylformamidase
LQEVVPGLYEFIAMPMKIHGADGAPARVVVRRITDSEGDIAPL